MKWAVFFDESTGYVEGSLPPRFDGPKKLIEVCGSDGVAVFDGRYGIERMAAEALTICRKRGFKGFSLEAGPRFTQGYLLRRLELAEG